MTEEEIKALQQQMEAANKRAEEAAAAVKRLEDNNKALLSEKLAAKEAADKAALDSAKKSGDVEALEKSWAEKLNQVQSAKDQELTGLKSLLDSVTRGATAATVAAEIFGQHADLMRPHVDSRLRTEIMEGKPQVRVLDAAGNLTALTVDDLKNEFKNSAKFASFVVGSRASGGTTVNTGSSSGQAMMTRSSFETLGPAQKAKFMKDGGTLTEG
jgi:hypothetical protein